MNNLCPSPWRREPVTGGGSIHTMRAPSSGVVPAADADAIANLEKFFENVESIKEDLQQIERAHRGLHESNESLKSVDSAATARVLRIRMDDDVADALKRAKLIKLKLESLDRSNASNRFVPGSRPGSSTERMRTSVVAGLRKKLRDQMVAFGDLRQLMAVDHREAVAQRFYAATGEKADEATVDVMEEEGEEIVKAAIAGKRTLEGAVVEMRERKGTVAQLERSLVELHHVFMDMEVMVETQGHLVDDIESQLGKASSFVDHGVEQLYEARRFQRNTRKCICIGVLILVIIVLLLVLFFVLKI
ncbi:Syntaxin-121 [Platanthera zijinensis]|uniref:Syntaxin-121 n=1 Tax=Platanthera zijinensis TaxID=2320716 RepID=A0AAP0C1Z8_9ASPA